MGCFSSYDRREFASLLFPHLKIPSESSNKAKYLLPGEFKENLCNFWCIFTRSVSDSESSFAVKQPLTRPVRNSLWSHVWHSPSSHMNRNLMKRLTCYQQRSSVRTGDKNARASSLSWSICECHKEHESGREVTSRENRSSNFRISLSMSDQVLQSPGVSGVPIHTPCTRAAYNLADRRTTDSMPKGLKVVASFWALFASSTRPAPQPCLPSVEVIHQPFKIFNH